jgi:hypothetical protein
MIKGLLFFAKISWKSSKKYVIYLFCNEIIAAVQPLFNGLVQQPILLNPIGFGLLNKSRKMLRILPVL